MRPQLSRLAVSDWLLGIASVALLVVLFTLRWYEVKPQFRDSLLELGERVSANGWQTFMWVGPLCLIVALIGIAAVWLQAVRRSPALPLVAVTVLMPLALLLTVVLVIRVFLWLPDLNLAAHGGNVLQTQPGAYASVGLSIVILLGGWLSLRREGVPERDAPTAIETIRIDSTGSASGVGHA